MQGKKDIAVEIQERALTLAPQEQRAMFRKTLDSYKEGKLPDAQ